MLQKFQLLEHVMIVIFQDVCLEPIVYLCDSFMAVL